MKKILSIPVHPIIFALSPVLYFLNSNLTFISGYSSVRAMLTTIALAGFFVVILYLVFRNFHRASIISSFGIILFTTFGFVNHASNCDLDQLSSH